MSSPLTCLFSLTLVLTSVCQARIYHIDAAASDDLRDGLSPATAWKSLNKFNATVFQAGDQILFKSGQHWLGQLRPQGSGKSAANAANAILPITIGRYGEGSLPEIRGAGLSLDTVLIEDIEYWTIKDLAVTNKGAATAPGRSAPQLATDCHEAVGTTS